MKNKYIFIVLFALILTSIITIYSSGKESDFKQESFRLSAVGDIAHPAYLSFAHEYYSLKGKKYDKTRDIFLASDISFANLETPYTNRKTTINKKYPFSTKPSELKYIFEAGFNLLSLANNHTADAGLGGIRDTISNLEKYEKIYNSRNQRPVIWAGAGTSNSKARKEKYFKIPGKNFEFVFLSYGYNSSRFVNRYSSRIAKADVIRIRKKNPNAIIIISIHYGIEYEHVPRNYIVKEYHSIIDAGGSIILAHHPHVPQGVENYNNGLICYSLGNFSFGSKTRRHIINNAKLYGQIITMDITQISPYDFQTELKIYPLYLDNSFPMKVGSRQLYPKPFIPFIPEKPFSNVILNSILKWSEKIPGNTTILTNIDNEYLLTQFTGTYNTKPNKPKR